MLYGRYHGKILGLAIRSGADGAWRAELREILAEFDNDCRDLSRFSNYLLHRELATQIEHEVLRFSDPDKQAVLASSPVQILERFEIGQHDGMPDTEIRPRLLGWHADAGCGAPVCQATPARYRGLFCVAAQSSGTRSRVNSSSAAR